MCADETEYEYSGSEDEGEGGHHHGHSSRHPDLAVVLASEDAPSMVPMGEDSTLRKKFIRLQEGRAGPESGKQQRQPCPPPTGALHMIGHCMCKYY
jgi:hypothetical protein